MEGVGPGGGGELESSIGQPRRWRLGDTIEDTRRESVMSWPVRRQGGGIVSIRSENDVRSQTTWRAESRGGGGDVS